MERTQEGRGKTFLQVSKETGLCTTTLRRDEVLEKVTPGAVPEGSRITSQGHCYYLS